MCKIITQPNFQQCTTFTKNDTKFNLSEKNRLTIPLQLDSGLCHFYFYIQKTIFMKDAHKKEQRNKVQSRRILICLDKNRHHDVMEKCIIGFHNRFFDS